MVDAVRERESDARAQHYELSPCPVFVSVLSTCRKAMPVCPSLALIYASTVSMTLPSIDPTVGCNKGASYIKSPTYGVSSSRWGHLPRGGWRGAVRVHDKI